jgi:hypothetical protein
MMGFASLPVVVLLSAPILAAESPVAFTRKPTAVRGADGVRIDFAVNRATDVAVTVEDAGGKIVRHLVAGALGPNPPAPLKPNSLEQSLLWDGKDDRGVGWWVVGGGSVWGANPQPATPNPPPFRVRVALGLGARFDKIVVNEPENIGGPKALAVGPDGTLYACVSTGANLPNWSGERIVALDRDGKYLRTVQPWPADLTSAQVAGFGVYDLDGRPAPLLKDVAHRSFFAGHCARKSGMAVTPDGVILRPVGGYNQYGNGSVAACGVRGDAPWGQEAGPKLLDLRRLTLNRPFVAVSADGKHAYVSGLGDVRPDQKPDRVAFSAVYRVALPGRGPATPFFGRPEEPGNDETHLGASVRGLAADGRGRLLIADHANNRVALGSEADGTFLGQFAVRSPDGLGVDRKTGAVYVLSLSKGAAGDLIKFAPPAPGKAPQELARLPVAGEGNPDFPPVLAVDDSAQPVIVWLGTDGGRLYRIVDQGATLAGRAIGGGQFGTLGFVGLEVDRYRPAPEVYFRCELRGGYAGDGTYFRYLEGEDKVEQVNFPGSGGVGGTCIVPGPNGVIYAPAYPQFLYRYTRDGQPLPWPAGNVGYPAGRKGPPHGIYAPVSMVYMTHTFGVRPSDGHFFLFDPGRTGDRPHKMLREYTPDGRLVSEDPIIWKVSDNCVGPKFDWQGNIYVAEQVKPLDQPVPPEFAALVGKVEPGKTSLEGQPVKNTLCTAYGSIVKFSPKGGMFGFTAGNSGGGTPYKGQPKLDPSLRTETYASYYGGRMNPLPVTGALWVRMGVSHECLHYCNCENTRFDVDGFGRVWYPDLARFRVCVLDTNGNDLMHFGQYGNADARDQLAFAWLIGVGVTDRYAYLGDSLNRRLLRAKLTCAAEQTCDVALEP